MRVRFEDLFSYRFGFRLNQSVVCGFES